MRVYTCVAGKSKVRRTQSFLIKADSCAPFLPNLPSLFAFSRMYIRIREFV